MLLGHARISVSKTSSTTNIPNNAKVSNSKEEVVHNMYQIAFASVNKNPQEIFNELLLQVINHFETLNHSEDGNPLEMPAYLREAVVLLAISIAGSINVTSNDVVIALNVLGMNSAKLNRDVISTKNRDVIKKYVENALVCNVNPLNKSIELCQEKSYRFKLRKEYEIEISNLHAQGKTWKAIYVEFPQYRLPTYLCDVAGARWLRMQGIGGPISNEQIMQGKFTIEQANHKMKEILIQTNEYKDLKLPCKADLRPRFIRYIVDGSLEKNEATWLTSTAVNNLLDEKLQDYIDMGELTMAEAINLTWEGRELLTSQKFYDPIILKRVLTLKSLSITTSQGKYSSESNELSALKKELEAVGIVKAPNKTIQKPFLVLTL